MIINAMKMKIRFSTVTCLGVGLLCILAGAGCTSSGSHALNSHDTQCLTGESRPVNRESLAHYQGLGFTHGSVVSRLGDAPSESDWDMTRGLPTELGTPGVDQVAGIGQTGASR